jgi:hypothetical protein
LSTVTLLKVQTLSNKTSIATLYKVEILSKKISIEKHYKVPTLPNKISIETHFKVQYSVKENIFNFTKSLKCLFQLDPNRLQKFNFAKNKNAKYENVIVFLSHKFWHFFLVFGWHFWKSLSKMRWATLISYDPIIYDLRNDFILVYLPRELPIWILFLTHFVC